MSMDALNANERTPEQIEADLERSRAQLADSIDQLYARVQPAALAQDAKESLTHTVEDAVGGNVEALKKLGIALALVVGGVGAVVFIATRGRRARARQARLLARELTRQLSRDGSVILPLSYEE